MEQLPCLDIANLTTLFRSRKGVVRAVDGLSLKVGKGELLGLVGESGCGKSVTLLSVLRLIPYPGETVSGSIIFEGKDLLKKSKEEMRKVRGMKISMVFQDPMTSLNPVLTIGKQMKEVMKLHLKLKEQALEDRCKLGWNRMESVAKWSQSLRLSIQWRPLLLPFWMVHLTFVLPTTQPAWLH